MLTSDAAATGERGGGGGGGGGGMVGESKEGGDASRGTVDLELELLFPTDIRNLDREGQAYGVGGGSSWQSRVEKCRLGGGDRLDLSRLGLTDSEFAMVTDIITSEFSELNTLNLRLNRLTELPTGLFSALPQLEVLVLSHNYLTALPSDLSRTSNPLIDLLAIDHNSFRTVPEAIPSLTSLARLHIQRNQLTDLPSNMKQLTSLSTLLLGGNPLSSLGGPSDLSMLVSYELEHLDITDMPNLDLTSVSMPLLQLTKDRELYRSKDRRKSAIARALNTRDRVKKSCEAQDVRA
mmetsp:Transcript_81225/g.230527  ORF Transcript_81225/g.230527 Transcript_81225/m.230527 type:complete len:293 (+) Transcript_81225:1-879(+)